MIQELSEYKEKLFKKIVEEAEEYLRSKRPHFNWGFRIPMLAAAIHTDERCLQKAYKFCSNTTPQKRVNDLRVEKMEKDLCGHTARYEYDKVTINDACADAGFNSYPTCHHVFYVKHLMPPTDYQKNCPDL